MQVATALVKEVVPASGVRALNLVELSVVEQRYRAVLAVERGEPKYEVAARARELEPALSGADVINGLAGDSRSCPSGRGKAPLLQ